ncbi:two-component system, chemotaxis family, response regulator CheY [Humidesulfovibrio mexicanus]|uniref:Two-component system, chemotaxis family, response regulator CheY n=1 Tax=Humidesulfovibrio mexicanus TaxID=147047 RepID=A0A238Z6C1_9BACT|nr:response regulator [Humidesulfovibrio mexicanus]SNR78353.1 two-component system, chemotaxis family, response regulator CheY [Humidesulfovibrio mexicanus]
MRALIVDDDFYSRIVLHDMLRAVAECHIAVNGEEAVGAFKKALEDGRGYDLVCMDLVMPEMDGQQALREMRALEDDLGVAAAERCVVFVVSMVEDNRETNEAFFLGGADSFLVKPIEEARLLAELREHRLLD